MLSIRTISVSALLCFILFNSSDISSQSKIIHNKNNSNTRHSGNLNSLLGGMGYAFNYTGTNTANFIEFSYTGPGTQTILGAVSGKSFYGADFNLANNLYAMDGSAAGTASLYRIDTLNGSSTFIGSAPINTGQRMTGLTYDSALTKWYAASTDGTTSALYIVNITTGSLIFIGTISGSPSVVSISASPCGTLFGVDNSTDNLIKISTLTASSTVVGPLGVNIASYQGMDFNSASGILYLCANAPTPQLRTVDTTSGASTSVGNITGTTLVTGFAIQFGTAVAPPPENGLCQSFNSSEFPPTGWVIINSSDEYWSWTQTTAYCLGNGSAEYDYYDAVPGVIESLNTSVFTAVNGTTDSLIMQEAYATYQTEDDQLQILTSVDTGASWIPLVTLHGGVNGELVTASPTLDPFIPGCTEWQRLAFRLPGGTNRVQFHTISAYGNNLYLDSICIAGSPIGIDPVNGNIPSAYNLFQNYPNPFNPSTKINYSLPVQSNVSIKIYDALGRIVVELVNENKNAGNYSVTFEAGNLSSGIYFYRIEASSKTGKVYDFIQTKKMLMIK